MTMTCGHVPENQYLFTDIVYDDPSLACNRLLIAEPCT